MALLGTLSMCAPQTASWSTLAVRFRALWRYDDISAKAAWPNWKPQLTHHRHHHEPHTWGLQRISRLRCVDNSKLGREAMAEGRPPYIIQPYSWKHKNKPHGAYAMLGTHVLVAVKGEKKHGIVVGVKQNQLPGIPKFDSNNVVLIEENGNPLGTRIHAPIPNCIRPYLKSISHHKKADYTKLFAIATKFV